MSLKNLLFSILAITIGAVSFVLLTKTKTATLAHANEAIPASQIVSISDYQAETESATREGVKTAAAIIAEDILAHNPEGPKESPSSPGIATIKISDPALVAQKILDSQTEKMGKLILDPPVSKSNINISKTENISSYLASLKRFFEDSLTQIATADIKKMDDLNMKKIIKVSDELIKQMYAMPVPEKISSLHIEQLKIIIGRRTIFTYILNRETDPVTAAVAVGLISKLEEKALNFNNRANELVAKMNISE